MVRTRASSDGEMKEGLQYERLMWLKKKEKESSKKSSNEVPEVQPPEPTDPLDMKDQPKDLPAEAPKNSPNVLDIEPDDREYSFEPSKLRDTTKIAKIPENETLSDDIDPDSLRAGWQVDEDIQALLDETGQGVFDGTYDFFKIISKRTFDQFITALAE